MNRALFFALVIFAAAVAVSASNPSSDLEVKLTENHLLQEMVTASHEDGESKNDENNNNNEDEEQFSPIEESSENSGEFDTTREALEALDTCQQSNCGKARSRLVSLVRRRLAARNRLAACQKRYANCPAGTSHCINLRRRILNLVRRYRFFGAKLRQVLAFAKLVAWGPKDHYVQVPKFVLAGRKRGNETEVKWSRPGKAAPRAAAAPKKGSKGGVFRRLLPLPGDDAIRNRLKQRKLAQAVLKKQPKTWWRDFVRKALGKKALPNKKATKAGDDKIKRRPLVKGFWGRLFRGRRGFYENWRRRRLLRRNVAALNEQRKNAYLAQAPLRARRRYWKKVWKRFAGRKVRGAPLWKDNEDYTTRQIKKAKKAETKFRLFDPLTEGRKGRRFARRGGRKARRGGRKARRGGRKAARRGRKGRRGARRGARCGARRGARKARRGGRKGRKAARRFSRRSNRNFRKAIRSLRGFNGRKYYSKRRDSDASFWNRFVSKSLRLLRNRKGNYSLGLKKLLASKKAGRRGSAPRSIRRFVEDDKKRRGALDAVRQAGRRLRYAAKWSNWQNLYRPEGDSNKEEEDGVDEE